MSDDVARIDELERYPIEGQDGLTWLPVRRHFGIQSFGVNAYTAEEAGQRLVEEHREEENGHEELYVVVSGHARFVLDGEPYDAPAIRQIIRDSRGENYRFSRLIVGIVQSTPFQMSRFK